MALGNPQTIRGYLGQQLRPGLDITLVAGGMRETRLHSALLRVALEQEVAGRSPPAVSFQCGYCPVGFASEEELQCHIGTHTSEHPFRCRYCAMFFSRREHLNRHVRRSHTGERPHACVHCPKSFTRKDNLRRHVLLHHQ